MDWYWWVLIALFVLVILPLFITSAFAFKFIFKGPKGEGDFAEIDLSDTGYAIHHDNIKQAIKFFKDKECDSLELTSFDGLKLKGYYYNNNSNKTILFVHGYNALPLNNFAVVGRDLYNEGYNIFFLHQRAHNDSEGKYTTFGIKERKDVVAWAHKLNELYNPEKMVIYGMSMGCASTEMAISMDIPSNVKCAVLDCGFKALFPLMMSETKKRIKINPFFSVLIMNMFTNMFAGFSMFEASAEESLKKAKVPCFFIHGKADETVPFSHAEANYEACSTEKEKYFIDDVLHAQAYYYGGEDLKNKLIDFLRKHVDGE